MGIFALKLMGDFSQELYSLNAPNHVFFANDRVSSARYILLKTYGYIMYHDEIDDQGNKIPYPLINIPGSGGFLSYFNKQNNFYMIMGTPIDPSPAASPVIPPIQTTFSGKNIGL